MNLGSIQIDVNLMLTITAGILLASAVQHLYYVAFSRGSRQAESFTLQGGRNSETVPRS